MKEMTKTEVQKLSLEILKDVHDFCVKNGIKYSLSGGSLLGAIRHGGFIPWDDDIDIQLPRPDYERLIHEYESSKGYKLFCRELNIDDEDNVYTYARICDIEKTIVDKGVRPWCKEPVGVWIDVLPCDGMPGNEADAKKHLNKVGQLVRSNYRKGYARSSWSVAFRGNNLTEKLKFLFKKIVAMAIWKDPYPQLLKERLRYNFEDSSNFFCTPHYGIRECQPRYIMEKFELHKFEDTNVYIMSEWHENLSRLFGDYMQIPPENKRHIHNHNKYYWK